MIYSLNEIPDVINDFICREHFHLIIRGDVHTGKSTYVQKLLSTYPFLTPYGFYTKKSIGEKGIHDGLYIHSASIKSENRFYNEHNRIALISQGCSYKEINTDIFDTVGVQLLSENNIKHNSVAIADEVGFLEGNAFCFLNAVKACFTSDKSVIAVFKNKSIPYLDDMLNIKGNMTVNVLPDFKFKITCL